MCFEQDGNQMFLETAKICIALFYGLYVSIVYRFTVISLWNIPLNAALSEKQRERERERERCMRRKRKLGLHPKTRDKFDRY
jgi:hypothetical protein